MYYEKLLKFLAINMEDETYDNKNHSGKVNVYLY